MENKIVDAFFILFIIGMLLIVPIGIIFLELENKVKAFFYNYANCTYTMTSILTKKVIYFTTWKRLIHSFPEVFQVEEKSNHLIVHICKRRIIIENINSIVLIDILF